jgi:hypothetical protein
LRETPLADPAQRTEWNVRDAARLMILLDRTGIGISKGTEAAREHARRLGKPCIAIDLDKGGAREQARAFLDEGKSGFSLCIAGPRESEAPGIYAKARAFLREIL